MAPAAIGMKPFLPFDAPVGRALQGLLTSAGALLAGCSGNSSLLDSFTSPTPPPQSALAVSTERSRAVKLTIERGALTVSAASPEAIGLLPAKTGHFTGLFGRGSGSVPEPVRSEAQPVSRPPAPRAASAESPAPPFRNVRRGMP